MAERISVVIEARDRLTRGLGRMGGAIGGFLGKLKSLRLAFLGAAAAAAGLGFAFSRAIRPFIQFETQLKGVQKTTDLSAQTVARLGDEFKKLSTQLPVSATDLGAIAQAGGQLGIQTAPKLLKFTKTIAEISLVTDLAAEEAATAFAKISNALGSPIEQVDRLASVVNELENTTAAKTREILAAMQRMASGARLLNVAASDVAALGASIVEVGFAGERGGTILNRVFVQMADNAEKIAEVMGVSFEEIQRGINENAIGVILDLIDVINQIPGQAQKLTVISDIFGQIGLKGFGALSQGVAQFRKNLETARTEFEANQSLMKELAIFQESLANNLKRLGNAFNALFLELGKGVQGPFKDFIENFQDAVPQLQTSFKRLGERIGETFAELDPEAIIRLVQGFTELAAILFEMASRILSFFDNAFKDVFTGMFILLDQAKERWRAFAGVVAESLASPVTALSKAQGVAARLSPVGALATLFGATPEAEAAAPAGGAMTGAPPGGGAPGVAGSTAQLDAVIVKLQQVGEQTQQVAQQTQTSFTFMADVVGGFGEGIDQFLLDLQQRWGETFGTLKNFVSNFAKTAAQAISASLGKAISNIILGAQSAGEAFKALGKALVKTVVEFVAQYAVQLLVAKALSVVFTAFIGGVAASLAAVWAPAAVLATIATFGAAAAQAPVAVAGALAAGAAAASSFATAAGGSIAALQEGGIVTQPTLALVGEAGPEAVVPLNQAGAFGGATINVNIDTAVLNTPENVDEFVEGLTEQIGRLMERRQMMPTGFA